MTRVSRAASSDPSSRSKSQARFCWAISLRCRRLARRETAPWRLRSSLSRKVLQPLQLIGRGEGLGGYLLVMAPVEDLVAEGLGVIENAVIGTPRLARVRHLLAVGICVELIGIGILAGLGCLSLLALAALIVAGLILAVLTFRCFLGILIAGLGILLVVLAFFALAFGEFLGQVERLEHVAQQAAERLLVLGNLVELRQRAAGALLDPGPPQLHHGLGGLAAVARRSGARAP